MEGYHYNEDAAEYAGNMPANDLEYRVIYVKDDPATGGSMTALSTDENGAEAGKSYSIATAQEMELFAAYVNAEKTTEDVTFLLNGNIEWPAGTAFTPIGTAENPFRGTFDGNYQTIMNLPNSLFGALDGAAVQNLGLSVNITGTEGKPVGAVAAVAEDSVITGCTVEAVIENTGAAGGLVGEANGTKVEQCAVTGSVQGTDAGGFIGKMTDGSVTNSSGEAAVSGSASAGGMVGTQSGTAAIRNCYATGDVTGSGSAKAGGLVGNAAGGTVENVYHSGTVTGGDAVFGAVSGAKSDSVWYSVGGTTSVSGVESFELTDAGVEALLTALNAWLMQENDESYLTWTVEAASDESADLSSEADVKLPVFGAAYTKWMTELKLEEGVVVYAFDNASCEDATICIACYAANDQMKAAFYLSVLEGELEVPAGVTYAKAFVMDQDSKPLSGAVGTA